ncbi:type II toxin-antitoxin system death-on-curing family toxin [bacterium]|nr:type II toxin-antitoxin system death-on-curing family toxin [bacterium]
MKIITLGEVEHLAVWLAKEMMTFKEPIPDFSTRFPNILESCLATPFQSFARRPLYQGLVVKAAVLFYLMIKNHPFQNGNKRIAMTTLFVFLYKNKKWLKVNHQELYNFAVWVAESPARTKTEVIKSVGNFFKDCMVDRK